MRLSIEMTCILLLLNKSDVHGYSIMNELFSEFGISWGPSTLYRTLKFLEDGGFIAEKATPDGEDQRRIYYTITDHGRHSCLRSLEDMNELIRFGDSTGLKLYKGINTTPPP